MANETGATGDDKGGGTQGEPGQWAAGVRALVAAESVAGLARRLGVPREAIAAYLAGSARRGTRLMVDTALIEAGHVVIEIGELVGWRTSIDAIRRTAGE